jgi:endonuclease/exonuclease/phosphatase family metal-dependent hydrolase
LLLFSNKGSHNFFPDADVVCLQEVSPLSFDDDFAFMTEELGYTGKEMFKRGRFRPATFWKRCELAVPAVHKDRTLLTAFRRGKQTWYVLNCHLQAGAEARRRVRQIQEGTKAVITLAKKLKGEGYLSTMFFR